MLDTIVTGFEGLSIEEQLALVGVAVAVVFGILQLIAQLRASKPASPPPPAEKPSAEVDVLARIRQTGIVRVGYVHYPPFTAMPSDRGAEAGGLYVDMFRELCLRNGLTPTFEQIRFSKAVALVDQDEFDAVLSIFQTPRRNRIVDFCAFMHTVSVSAVVRQSESRIRDAADLSKLDLSFVVCAGEIGHEIVEDHLRIPAGRVVEVNTSNVSDILTMVVDKKADVAIADSLSCIYGIDARGLEGPRLKPIFRRRPLYLCPNGIMIRRNQPKLAAFLNSGMKNLLAEDAFARRETDILERYHGVIAKL